jgi:hypothetical protein
LDLFNLFINCFWKSFSFYFRLKIFFKFNFLFKFRKIYLMIDFLFTFNFFAQIVSKINFFFCFFSLIDFFLFLLIIIRVKYFVFLFLFINKIRIHCFYHHFSLWQAHYPRYLVLLQSCNKSKNHLSQFIINIWKLHFSLI